jgi:hypothetical protein
MNSVDVNESNTYPTFAANALAAVRVVTSAHSG